MNKMFSVEFLYHTRPWFRKGKVKREQVAFVARDITEAYRLAVEDGQHRFRRLNWSIIGCKEIEAPWKSN